MAKPSRPPKGCPNCGFRRYKLAPSEPASSADAGKLPYMRDRTCRDCGTRYTPPMPGFVPYVIIVMGLYLAFFGIGAIMFGGELMKGPVKFRLWMKIALAVGGLVVVAAGVQLARKRRP
ncbi:hypothetical protein HQ560_13230 [bacterium]|nr:hypothetical protein [bacterium]